MYKIVIPLFLAFIVFVSCRTGIKDDPAEGTGNNSSSRISSAPLSSVSSSLLASASSSSSSIITFKVTYDPNGADTGSAPLDPTNYASSSAATVLDNSGLLTKNYAAFIGWNSDANGVGTDYSPSSSITVSGNVTLYAKWAKLEIHQFYGSGISADTTYKNDFVDLYNPCSFDINLTGWSIQFASATGTTWTVGNLSGTIKAHSFFLIEGDVNTGSHPILPPPYDAFVNINFNSFNGKIALVFGTTALPGTSYLSGCIDFLGYGSTADGYLGSGPSTTPNCTASVIRSQNTHDNALDFIISKPPVPYNSLTPALP